MVCHPNLPNQRKFTTQNAAQRAKDNNNLLMAKPERGGGKKGQKQIEALFLNNLSELNERTLHNLNLISRPDCFFGCFFFLLVWGLLLLGFLLLGLFCGCFF